MHNLIANKISWIEEYLSMFLNWFYQLDVLFQYLLLGVGLYILVLGTIEFVRKIVIFVPRKIIGIVAIIILIYVLFGFFQS